MTTYRYVEELLSAYADNTSGLIDAVQGRDLIVSYAPGRGIVVDETNVSLPIVNGSYLAINPLLVSPVAAVSLWRFDGNWFVIPDHASVVGVTVPAGYNRLAVFSATLALNKGTGGSDAYLVTFTRNGVPVGLAENVTFPAAGDQSVALRYAASVDVSLGTDTFGVSIQGNGTGDDLTMEYFSMAVEDAIRLSAP